MFVASVASLRGVPYAAHYAASKHGLLGLMRSLAAEYAKTNLTVNAVCPGYVDTPMTDQSVARVSEITGRSEDDARSAITNMNASGRLVDPQAIGNVIAMLCLPLSRDINGAAITHRRRDERMTFDPATFAARAFPVEVRGRRRDGHAQPAGAEEPADLRQLRRAALRPSTRSTSMLRR